MGVEYSYGIFVADTEWEPTWMHVEAIDAVLCGWGLVKSDPTYYTIGDAWRPIDEAAARAMPDNFAVVYNDIEGQSVARLMGASERGVPTKDRCIYAPSLIIGTDYKVLQGDGDEVTITTPPKNGTKAVEPDHFATGYSMTTLYPAKRTTTRPITDGPNAFDRVWRCGILFDCGKDIPELADGNKPLHDTALLASLAKAFGTELVCCGWYH